MDLNLNSINNYIDVNEANSTNIGIVPDSTLDVGSFDSEAIRYWNESLQELYKKYKELVSKDNVADGHFGINMTIRDGGDSGYHFSEGEPYVIPDKNADNKTYEEVRGDDKIDAVLQNQDNLQFTREKPSEKKSYVRLIMPKYSRRVEVEDLDRNFWVIGQALDQICDFLFNDQSPLNLILKSVLNELLGIWQNIYLLWGKVNDVEDGLNEIGSQAAKSNLRIQFTCSGDSWTFIVSEILKQTGIDISQSFYENNAKMENIYLFGSKKDTEGVELNPIPEWFTNEAAAIKTFYPWLFDNNGEFIYKDTDKIENTNDVYGFCGDYLTAEQRKYFTFPRIGGICKYTLNGSIYYLAYDFKHPYIVDLDFENATFKTLKYATPSPDFIDENGVASGQTIFPLNRYIYEESLDKELGSSVSTLGELITLERQSFDKRNFTEILYDLSQLNMTFISCSKSSSILKDICPWDGIPSIQKYTREQVFQGVLTMLAKACDYGITAKEDYYYTDDGETSGDGITFVHTGLIPLLNKVLEKYNLKDASEELNPKKYFYFDDLTFLSFLSRFKQTEKYNDFIEVFKLMNFSNLKNYTIFVNKILSDFGLTFKDYCEVKNITEINENNLGTYKNDYEDFCKGKINSFSDEDFKYLIKEYYPEEGIEGYVISNPFINYVFNDSDTGYIYSPQLTYNTNPGDDFNRDSHYLLRNLSSSSRNLWKCVFTLLPPNAFSNSNKLNYYENKLMTIKDHYNLPKDQGGAKQEELLLTYDNNVYSPATPIDYLPSFTTTKITERAETYGYLRGFETSHNNIKSQYLQPIEKFTGYWLYCESGSYLQTFLATPKIIGYNLRSMDGDRFSFYDTAFILKTFNPYEKEPEKFNNERISTVYEFNSPEPQPLYVVEPANEFIRPSILNRGKNDKIRYVARKGNAYKNAVVDGLIGIPDGITWGKELETNTIPESPNGVSFKKELENQDFSVLSDADAAKEKLDFSLDNVCYLNTNKDPDETLNWLRNSGVSNLFGSAVKSYLTKDICSPKFWFDTNGNNLWGESVKEFSFLQSSPYDSIYIYDSNQKELNVGHKYWKDFTIGELSNSKTINTFAVLLEFFKDTISSYNSDKAFVRFSVIREYEADNTSSEINSIVANPGGDVNAEGR